MSDWFGTYDGIESVNAELHLECPSLPPVARNCCKRSNKVRSASPRWMKVLSVSSNLSRPTIHRKNRTGNLKSRLRLHRPTELPSSNESPPTAYCLKNDRILSITPVTAAKIAATGFLATDREYTSHSPFVHCYTTPRPSDRILRPLGQSRTRPRSLDSQDVTYPRHTVHRQGRLPFLESG